jgi:hypothetical protein
MKSLVIHYLGKTLLCTAVPAAGIVGYTEHAAIEKHVVAPVKRVYQHKVKPKPKAPARRVAYRAVHRPVAIQEPVNIQSICPPAPVTFGGDFGTVGGFGGAGGSGGYELYNPSIPIPPTGGGSTPSHPTYPGTPSFPGNPIVVPPVGGGGVSPVPEPATYASIMLGIGVIGGAARYRRAKRTRVQTDNG